MKKGDLVVLKKPFWHQGMDIGDRLGTILSTEGHILVEVMEYDANPVKCFRHEVELSSGSYEDEIEELFDQLAIDFT